MCGIVGGFASRREVEAGLAALKHRGPDARGLVKEGKAWLGHARLSIMDLDARSNQPFRRGGTLLTYNGELWNYAELRKKLEKTTPMRFRTTGDTEVFASALEWLGVAALKRFSGMFAAAWTPDGGETLHLARDRFGEVPAHFATKPFRFASEKKALLAMGVEPDKIHSVPPGAVLTARASEDMVHVKDYYDAPVDPVDVELEEAAAKLRKLLEAGAAARAMTDVPACVLLSGGVDSSAIAHCLKPHLPNLVGYTAVMDERSRDLRCARAVAEALSIPLVEVRVPPPREEDLAMIVRVIEMPYKAQVEIGWPCYLLAHRMRADGFKVTFGGEGSDELWASYGFAYYALDVERQDWHLYRKKLFLDQARKNFPRSNKIFMSAGVECRLPFLHETVVEHALRLPRAAVQLPRRPKAVIQEAFRGLLPDEVVDRPKVAFQDGLGVKRNIAERIARPKEFYQSEYDLVFGKRRGTLWKKQ